MSDFDEAYDRYEAARARFHAICAVAADAAEDDADAACDELTAAQWALVHAPATGFADVQKRAQMVRELVADTIALLPEDLLGAALAVLLADILGDAEIARLQHTEAT